MYKSIIFLFSTQILLSSHQSTVTIKTQKDFNTLVDAMEKSVQHKIGKHFESTGQPISISDTNLCTSVQLNNFKHRQQTAQLVVRALCCYQDHIDSSISVTCQGSDERFITISHQLFLQNTKKKSFQCVIL